VSNQPFVRPEPNELQQRIIQASVQLLEEQGIAALSMREVARRAGVSHQAPYHHFQDRESILAAIAEEGFRKLHDSFVAALEANPESPLHERVAGAARVYIDFALANPAHFRVMFRPELVNLRNCPSADAEGDRAFGLLSSFVDTAVAQGLPAYPSKDALVLLFWSVAHGFACLALDGPLAHKTPDAERAQQAQDVVVAFATLVKGAAGS
jgi:AcrR family transcriptional regulator